MVENLSIIPSRSFPIILKLSSYHHLFLFYYSNVYFVSDSIMATVHKINDYYTIHAITEVVMI